MTLTCSDSDASLQLYAGEERMGDYLKETKHDRFIRKFSMISILVIFVLVCNYKCFAAIGFGYYTFGNFDRLHCYADSSSIMPT